VAATTIADLFSLGRLTDMIDALPDEVLLEIFNYYLKAAFRPDQTKHP
jgi:hypothetical protein